MPFGFGKREDKPRPASESDSEAAQAGRPVAVPTPSGAGGIAFDGLTEEWRLVGIMDVTGRLSDALNRRDAISIRDVNWAPLDGSEPFSAVPGLRSIDPYDLIVVLAGEGTLPDFSEDEKAALANPLFGDHFDRFELQRPRTSLTRGFPGAGPPSWR